MKSLALNLKDAKKTASDENFSTFSLPSGHELRVAHHALSALQRKQLEAMPVQKMADGGDVPAANQGDRSDPSLVDENGNPPLRYDGAGRSDEQIVSDQNAAIDSGRAPASLAGDVGNYLGNAVKEGVGSGVQAMKSVLTPVGDVAQGFFRGVTGQNGQVGPPEPSAPAPKTDLPDMGTPVTGSAGPAPASLPSVPGATIPGLSIGGIYGTGLQGINAEQQAQSDAGAAKLQADKMYAAQQVAEEANWETERQSKMQEVQAAINDVKNGHIDPNHYLENQGVGGKIATAIGLILGGAGAHSMGGQNLALNFLNDQINRDVSAQKANLDNNATVLGAYQNKYRDAIAAENMTRATQYGIYASKLQQAADASADPLAKARALQAKSALQSQILPLVNRANAIQMLNTRAQQKAANPAAFSGSPVDYPALNTLQKTGVMPAPDVEAATKEAQTYSNHVKQVGTVMNTWDQANKDNSVGNRALHGGFEPASVSALKTSLLPYLKDAEGRINEQELARTDGLIPAPGDGAAKTTEKRAAMAQFLAEKNSPESFPTLSRYGLINPSPQATQEAPRFKVGDVVRVHGQKMQIIDKGGNLKPVS